MCRSYGVQGTCSTAGLSCTILRHRQLDKPRVEIGSSIIVDADLVLVLLSRVHDDFWEEVEEEELFEPMMSAVLYSKRV